MCSGVGRGGELSPLASGCFAREHCQQLFPHTGSTAAAALMGTGRAAAPPGSLSIRFF